MTESTFVPPADYARIKCVQSFAELLATPFRDGLNALCWPRELTGNFTEVVNALGAEGEEIVHLTERRLNALTLSREGREATRVMLEDLALLDSAGMAPELNCIYSYPRAEEAEIVPTDVYSFHADSAPHEMATFLCSYTAPASEGLRNDEGERFVDLAEFRQSLWSAYGGSDAAEFDRFQSENCYHLHYQPKPLARPFSFGVGNLWRIAVEYPGSAVPPCIHRAPATRPGQTARLLLIS